METDRLSTGMVPGERSGRGKRKLIADDLDGRRARVGSTPSVWVVSWVIAFS